MPLACLPQGLHLDEALDLFMAKKRRDMVVQHGADSQGNTSPAAAPQQAPQARSYNSSRAAASFTLLILVDIVTSCLCCSP